MKKKGAQESFFGPSF